jgi:hypothetical protein
MGFQPLLILRDAYLADQSMLLDYQRDYWSTFVSNPDPRKRDDDSR